MTTKQNKHPQKSCLHIQNARENNLKSVSIDLPHDEFTVVTGVSGSGKSSLAFNTIYAEGQRRYIETFSPYTRQFLSKVKRPDADVVQQVRPAIAIEQKTRITSSRSTVGSITSLNDYLKTLWTNICEPYCPSCGIPLKSWTPDSLTNHLVESLSKEPDTSFMVCSPLQLPVTKKGKKEEMERLQVLGYARYLTESGETKRLEESKPAIERGPATHYVVLDRHKSEKPAKKRLLDSVQQAFSLSVDACAVAVFGKDGDLIRISTFSKQLRCACSEAAEFEIPKLRPAIFSYNHPLGACEECNGFGKVLALDVTKVVPDQSLSIEEYAVHCWSSDSRTHWHEALLDFCDDFKIAVDTPWRDLKATDHTKIIDGAGEFPGVRGFFKLLERKKYKLHVRVFLSKYRDQVDCHVCGGSRLKPGALAYMVDGLTIADLWTMPAENLLEWVKARRDNLPKKTSGQDLREICDELTHRLHYLCELGLPYLTLDRQARTLSGGETQRVNLVAALGSGLSSTHFILDEPSVGLHPRDTERLLASLDTLKEKKNSVLVVEHDPEVILKADRIVEVGPDAGAHGGQIVFNDHPSKWDASPLEFEISPRKSLAKDTEYLEFEGASARNLQAIDVRIPVGVLSCITGVSGSGKSSFVEEVLLKSWKHTSQGLPPANCTHAQGFDAFETCILVDQSPLAKSPRANIATYTKMWDAVRDLLASTDSARERGYTKSTFSFNVDKGRCPVCKGAGFIKEDMQFLSDVHITCDSCLGKRFTAPVLEVEYRGKSVYDFLQMTVDDAGIFFSGHPSIGRSCDMLSLLGLGHLRLGHPLSELSGGEAQRLKLIPYVQKANERPSLLVFDEPTTGLHVKDVTQLLELFGQLLSRGHTVLCVEHNTQVIGNADWIIDLGPEGGSGGGQLMFQGASAKLTSATTQKKSLTAQYLAKKAPAKAKNTRGKKRRVADTSNIALRGAREHNLKNISLDIPLNSFIAFTGVSGSGKSTLARDILFAEGQRRYLDCLSPYARQFIKELAKPDIEHIEGVPPSICVAQHTTKPSKRATVGTLTEAYSYLRLLYTKLGIQHCPDHPDQAISPMSIDQMVAHLKARGKERIRVLARVIQNRKGTHKAVVQRAIASDISELRIDGHFVPPGKAEELLERHKTHTIEYVLAHCAPASMPDDILADMMQQAMSLGSGTVTLVGTDSEEVLSQERTCPECHRGFHKLDPEDLSFHSRRGRCEACDGLGTIDGEVCGECNGSRLNARARNVRLHGYTIHDLCTKQASELVKVLETFSFPPQHAPLAEPILAELIHKLEVLQRLGLDYLPLERDCRTLAAGELQRLRLATALGSPLQGVLYVFDEPSASLHPEDTENVLRELRALQQRGNTVVLIEHDLESVRLTDHVIDVGPGGGSNGGSIVYEGPTDKLWDSKESVTALAMQQRDTLQDLLYEEKRTPEHHLSVINASKHTIKDLTLDIPLQCLVTIAGVSGAGKSTLVHDLVVDSWFSDTSVAAPTDEWSWNGVNYRSTLDIARVLVVDQRPLGANARSTPASYLNIWGEVRKLYATTLEARALGYTASFFSYNTGKGRCPECKGTGELKLEMSFLANARVECPLCEGKRFREEANSITYLNASVSDVLAMTFEEAKSHFANHRKIHQALHLACELGLGYLTLGQPSSSLSGGESQRLRLVQELSTKRRDHTLYILDEPSTGLHKADIHKLSAALKRLVQQGHTVWLIEHDEDLLCASDHVIEMGPGPGVNGGKVIFEGSPAGLRNIDSPWGRTLEKMAVSNFKSSKLAATA